MVEMLKQNIREDGRRSSKGNQMKWFRDGIWYKADYTGYEGLAEYMISSLLGFTSLKQEEYVRYETEEIRYGHQIYQGCRSRDFLPSGWQIITLERLFQNCCGQGLNRSLYSISDHEKRLTFLVDQTERITGLKDFGSYMSKLLTIDTFFKNEDRHTHNIAVLMDPEGRFHLCPIFDNGAGFLSDTTMDYPMHVSVMDLIDTAEAKTFCRDFDEQLDLVEMLYGQHIRFQFGEKEISQLLEDEKVYSVETKNRIRDFLLMQRRRYHYLFQ